MRILGLTEILQKAVLFMTMTILFKIKDKLVRKTIYPSSCNLYEILVICIMIIFFLYQKL